MGTEIPETFSSAWSWIQLRKEKLDLDLKVKDRTANSRVCDRSRDLQGLGPPSFPNKRLEVALLKGYDVFEAFKASYEQLYGEAQGGAREDLDVELPRDGKLLESDGKMAIAHRCLFETLY